MRFWCEVYTLGGTFEGIVYNLVTVSKNQMLDGAGSISVSYSAADERATTLIQKERELHIYVEQDGSTRLFERGVIRDINVSAGDKTLFTATGPDTLDGLTRKTVGLRRSYTSTSVYNIVTDLLAIIGNGWFATVDDGAGVQTARFDGVSVLKALIRTAQELGLHLREGLESKEVEIGAFGEDIGVTALAPGSLTADLATNDSIVIITDFKQKSSTRDICNTVTPLGAGEGTAALTLRDAYLNSTRGTINGDPYDILTTTFQDGSTNYYLQDDTSIDLYDVVEKPPVVFKEIGPVANSAAAKILAANALYDAAAAYLQRQSVALETYNLNVTKVHANIRPGNLIGVKFKDIVETVDGYRVPVDVNNNAMWVMKTTETISDSGMSMALEVSTVDRHVMDITETVVGAIESMNVKNISVATFPFYYQDASERDVQGTLQPSSNGYKDGEWTLQFPDLMVDVMAVKFQIFTRSAIATTDEYWGTVGTPPYQKYYYVTDSGLLTPLYPSVMSIYVNDVDVTTALGGPWNPNGENAAVNVTVDISPYILNASGGIFQTHKVRIRCGQYASPVDHRTTTGYATVNSQYSVGKIEGKFLVLGSAQAIKPA